MPSSLRKIDAKNAKIVVKSSDLFTVYDLETDTQTFQCQGEAWFSRNTVVKTDTDHAGMGFTVISLNHMKTAYFRMIGVFSVFQVEVIQDCLVVGSNEKGVITVDLMAKDMQRVSRTPPLVYFEAETMEDALVVLPDGTSRFLMSPHVNLNTQFSCPVFTDLEDLFLIYDEGHLVVIDMNNGAVYKSNIGIRRNVTCIGLNEDTMEVYLGCSNGQIITLKGY